MKNVGKGFHLAADKHMTVNDSERRKTASNPTLI